MKDITISAKQIRQEILSLSVCFFIGFLINGIAIIMYGGSWSELFTALPYVILFAIFIYAIWSGIRLVYFVLKKYFSKKKNDTIKPNLNQ